MINKDDVYYVKTQSLTEFKNTIRDIRIGKRLNKKKMANHLGISYPTYCNYEYGNREPNLSELVRIAKVLEVTTDCLLKGRKL